MKEENQNLHLIQVDLKDFDKYSEVHAQVESIVKDEGLNVLFNSAGVSPKRLRNVPNTFNVF